MPTLETLAAVSILREHLPELKIRVVNVVDLMKLQPNTERGCFPTQRSALATGVRFGFRAFAAK